MSAVQGTPPVPAAEGKIRKVPVWLMVVIGIVLVLLLAVVIITLLPVPVEGNINPDFRNEQVYAALAANGITDAAVDTGADRVLVSAVVTDSANVPKVKYIVAGAVSQIQSPPRLIIIEVFGRDNRLIETSRIETAAVQQYIAGEITMAELEKRIQIS